MKNEIKIRNARVSDIPRLLELLQKLFAIEKDFDFDAEKQAIGLKMLIESDGSKCVLVTESEFDIVAMCSVQTIISTAEGGRSCWVEDLVVKKEFRGRQIATLLLRSIEAWAKANDVSRLQLLADFENSRAIEFYLSRGWTKTQLICMRKAEIR